MEGTLVRSASEGEDSDIITLERDSAEGTVKIMFNNCFGGFSLSDQAVAMYKAKKGIPDHEALAYASDEFPRHDEDMIAIVEALGPEASGQCSEIRIAKIPAKFLSYYYISEYDGSESVSVDHKQYKLDQIQIMLSSTDAFQQATYHQRAVLEDIMNVIQEPLKMS